VHVFGPAERFAYASSRNFTPVDAPKERLFDLHRHLGVERCVIVQSAVHDHGPTSFASYDLTAAEVMGSPAWLAVRATDWSSRCRPHFTNTRRTFFQSLHTLPGASP